MFTFLKSLLPASPAVPRTPRRTPSFRPDLEPLEDRRVMTASGNISAVVDNLGHSVEYGIALDNTVWQYAPSGWTSLGAPPGESITQVSAGKDASGRAQVFAIGADRSLWLNDGAGWQNLQGAGYQVSGTDNNEVYAIGMDHAVWVNNLAAGTGWQSLGGWLGQISVGKDRSGHDQVFGLGGDGSTWVNDGAGWQNLGAPALQIEGTANDEVYILGTDHAVWLNNLATGGGWQSRGGNVQRISAGTDTQGRDEVFAIGSDGTPWKNNSLGWHQLSQTTSGNSIGGRSAGTGSTYLPYVMDIAATGNDTLFAVSTDNTALKFHLGTWQGEAGGILR